MSIFLHTEAINVVQSDQFEPISLITHVGKAEEILVRDLLFELEYRDYSVKTSEERIILCKPRIMLEMYLQLFSRVKHAKILEFGIFQGGSSLFLGAVLKKLQKLVAIDLRRDNGIIQRIIKKKSLQDKLSLFYKTPQDSPAVKKIIEREMGGQPDIVIDDCSHLYAPTKASFEMVFPMLAPGGLYIIEDWSWAHSTDFQGKDAFWHDEPALTNFIFDLITLQGSHPGWITDISISSLAGMVIIKKGQINIHSPLRIDEEVIARGKTRTLI